MFNSKTLISIQSLLLLSRCVLGQSLTANSSLYLPGDSFVTLDPGEVLVASPISVSGSATIYEIVDSDPTSSFTQTVTLELSPSGAVLHQVGTGPAGEEDLDTTCTFTGDNSVCQVIAVGKLVNLNGTGTVTTSITSTYTEAISSLPVVALALQTTAAPSPTTPASPTTTNTATNTPSSSAISPSISIGLVTLITFGLAVKLL